MPLPGWVRGAAGAVRRIPQNIMPVNPELEGLLGPEVIGNARREGLLGIAAGLHAAGSPDAPPGGIAGALLTGRQAFNQSMGAGFGQKQALEQYGQQKDLAARRAEVQQRVGSLFDDPNMTQEQRFQELHSLLGDAYSVGDTQTLGALSQAIQASRPDPGPDPKLMELLGPDGKPALGFVTPGGVRFVPGARPYQKPAAGAGRLVTATNPATGLPEYAHYTPGSGFAFTGVTPSSNRDASTEGERKTAVLLQIAGPSIAALDSFDAPNRLEQFASQRALNEFINSNQQELDVHSLAVADAYVRLTSGANAPDGEVQRVFRMILPRPGDTKQTLGTKRALRQRLLQALEIGAGRAASRVTPDTPHAASPAATSPAAPAVNTSRVKAALGGAKPPAAPPPPPAALGRVY